VQAEGVVGFLNAHETSGDEKFLNAYRSCWEFIRDHLVDRVHGDWFYRTDREGRPYRNVPKVSEWKCPYHSGRMCLESMRRLDHIMEGRNR
jgi:cellobiose epimerase